MQSRQIVAHHSSRSSTRRNTQSIPLLAGLFCASLTGCILEQQNGSSIDIPDLTTLPDLRADLLPPPDLAAPCGSDGIYVTGTGPNSGKCVYNFYQPDAITCTGASVTLYQQKPNFKQICNCVCDRSSLSASLYYGSFCGGITPKTINTTTQVCPQLSGNLNVSYDALSGQCSRNLAASWTSWRLEPSGSTYCLLSTDAHRQNPPQECILIDSAILSCPDKYQQRRDVFNASSALAPTIDSCNCCAKSDYPDVPVLVFLSTDCSDTTPLSPVPKKPDCLGLGTGANSASLNPNYCPTSYSKTLPATSQTVATQTVCCKLP